MLFKKLINQLAIVAFGCFTLGGTIIFVDYLEARLKPQQFIRELFAYSTRPNVYKHAIPVFEGSQIKKTILGAIDATPVTGSIIMATFILTDQAICDALASKFKQGTDITIIADATYASTAWSKIPYLRKIGVPIYLHPLPEALKQERPPIMHNKFIVCRNTPHGTITITGSFNHTNSAAEKNEENIIVLTQPEIGDSFAQHFEELKQRSVRSL